MIGSGPDIWLVPDRLFDGTDLREGMAIGIKDGKCIDTKPTATLSQAQKTQHLNGTLTPGFVDLQVNGGGGILLNNDPTPEAMQTVAAAHRSFGTVAILPTIITDQPEALEAAAQSILRLTDVAGIAGLHVEGPHISHARHGTHREAYIRPMDDHTMAVIERLRAADVPTMITLAPESTTMEQIAALNEMGAVVSLGHSNVSSDEAKAAFAAGAQCVTHLFNAMSPMQNREPGLTGAAINCDVGAGIICDGIHVADDMVGLAFRAKHGARGMFLVSDAMATVGGPDHFILYDERLTLENGRLVNEKGSLAGAHTTVGEGLARLVNIVGIDLQTAMRAAISNPSKLMGLDLHRIEGRSTDELLLLNEDLSIAGTIAGMLPSDSSLSA